MRNMNNPFKYGGIVGSEAFCNRKKELSDLLRVMENSERLFVYSERRMGKTSLLKLALEKLPRGKYIAAYVDLWPTDGELSFVAATAKAITEGMATTADKMLGYAKAFFTRLVPTITADEEGKPQISFGMTKSKVQGPELEEVLEAPANVARRHKCNVVVVFDEFQRLLEYDNDIVERKLRSTIQEHKNVSYIFSGSRKHLIQKMFLDKSRPLYRAGGHYPLGPIGCEDWLPFIRRRFHDSNRIVADNHIMKICDMTDGHPFYTQHLCHAVWDLCEERGEVTDDTLSTAVKILLNRESYAYTALWESLAVNQRRFLKGLAFEPSGTKVFASDFIQKHDLRSASNVQRVVSALLEKDIIDRSNGTFFVTDRFYKMWIRGI
jgi:hypothetical protein